MTPLTALAAFAARQHHVISTAQLRLLGWSDRGLRGLVLRGHLYRVHRGVYAFGRRDLTREGRWMAAVLASPAGAALSHVSAAGLWGVFPNPFPPPPRVLPPRR